MMILLTGAGYRGLGRVDGSRVSGFVLCIFHSASWLFDRYWMRRYPSEKIPAVKMPSVAMTEERSKAPIAKAFLIKQ